MVDRISTPTITVEADGDEDADLQSTDDLLGADRTDRRVEDLGQATIGDHQRKAAPGDEESERGDDRLHADDADEQSVEESGQDPGDRVPPPSRSTRRDRCIAASVAADSAMTAPTDRSMPPVATTTAMPSATITTGVTCTSCRRRLLSVAKLGVNNMLNAIMIPSAAYTPWVRRLTSRAPLTDHLGGGHGSPSARVLGVARVARHQLHDPVFVDLVPIELADDGTVLEHDHTGRSLDHVFQLRGDQHDPATLVGELLDE